MTRTSNTRLLAEISRELPSDIPPRYLAGGEPLFIAYGCVLLERDTGKTYVYKAVNVKNGRSQILSRRANPLTTSNVAAMVEKIRLSEITDRGRLGADMIFGESLKHKELQEIQTAIFRDILPGHGYTVREAQIELAAHILDTLAKRGVTLAESEVGTGKTHAYLVAAILAKRGRLNDFWNHGYYPRMSYVELAKMPIVISTSSIALQKAIVRDYIPELSRILIEHGVISKPLTAVIRKGKEHYACERNLRAHIPFEHDGKMRKLLKGLLMPNAPIDLAETNGLTPHVKHKICVPGRCEQYCRYYSECRYLDFLDQAQSPEIDIQVCNHNYLLADTLRRAEGQRPLIPNYQTLIIDEAHKFLAAARSMYGAELSSAALSETLDNVYELNFRSAETQKELRKMAKKLSEQGNRLFRRLRENTPDNGSDDDSERFTAVMNEETAQHLRNIRDIAGMLSERLFNESVLGKGGGRQAQTVWQLEQINNQADALAIHDGLICWLENPDGNAAPGVKSENLLCGIPKDLNERLYEDLWSKGIPTVLTSGTLSAGGDFSHIKRTLGLEGVSRLTETGTPSPFDYKENTLLYISETMPFPNNKDHQYIMAVADETERLIKAAHGHTVILFTSYKVMDMVWELLSKRGIPFPMFRLDKGVVNAIEQFKQSGNGVLFASGALWEGIDIPGDALSMLIIVKLPFAVPDPIGEYEQTLYNSLDEYKRRVIVPEMLLKLKQGFGRLIRTEKDTGAVAIFDSRANKHGAYRERALNALPEGRVTADISDVEHFMEAKKSTDYFL